MGLGKKDKNTKVSLTYCHITTQRSDYQLAFLANYMKYVGKLIKKLSPKNSHFPCKEFKCLFKKSIKVFKSPSTRNSYLVNFIHSIHLL